MERRGTNFTNLGKYLKANQNTGLATKVGQNLNQQAQGLTKQLGQAKEGFEKSASGSLVDPTKLADITKKAGEQGVVTDDEVNFFQDAAKGTYKGPRTLDEDTTRSLQTNAQGLQRAANSPETLLTSLFNNRQSRGGLGLDRAVLNAQGGTQALQEARLAGAQAARSVRGAQNEAQNVVNRLSEIQKSRANAAVSDLASRKAQALDAAKATTESKIQNTLFNFMPITDQRQTEQTGSRPASGGGFATPQPDYQTPGTAPAAVPDSQLEQQLGLPPGTLARYDRQSLTGAVAAAKNQNALTGTDEEKARLLALSRLSGQEAPINETLFNAVDLSKAQKLALPGSANVDQSIAMETYDIQNNPALSPTEKLAAIQSLPVKYGRATTRIAFPK